MKTSLAGNKSCINSGFTLIRTVVVLFSFSLLLIGLCSFLIVQNQISEKKLDSINNHIIQIANV